MPLLVNLRHLAKESLVYRGQLPPAELDLEAVDECIQIHQGLEYELSVQLLQQALLAQGRLSLLLDCTCVRCLKSFQDRLEIRDWICHLSPGGEEGYTVINDCVDLTPFLREDILLALPQHPVCEPGCNRLPPSTLSSVHQDFGQLRAEEKSSTWSELDKLKLD